MRDVMLLGALCLLAASTFAAELYVPPQTIAALKAYYPDTTLVDAGKATCAIVFPDEDGYADLAADVASAIKDAAGAEVPSKTDKQYTQADRATNLICLGRMNNNKLALDLYIFHYVACDDWFPGPEGYVVRTCCDPWGTGKNVIMLGGSDLDGVKLAVECFRTLLPKGNTLTIPRTIRTQFKGSENTDQLVAADRKYYHDNFIDVKHLPYGCEGRMEAVAARYLLTGRDEYCTLYALLMRRWMDEYYRYTPDRQITQPKYAIPDMILTFDQMEESPLIPADLKLEMTNLLYDYASRMSVHGRITQLKPGVLASDGLHAVSETVIYGDRYFRQYYPSADFERLDKGVASVKIGQQTMSSCYGFIDEDGGYTQSYPTTSMKLALAMENDAFFSSGAARKWMEYCMNVTDNGRQSFFGPSASFAIAAWYYQDPTYVWFNIFRKWGQSTYYPEMKPDSFTYFLWTYLPNIEPREPQVTGGLHYMPVHPVNYEQMKRTGRFINVPQERTFSQLAMRESFGIGEQYMRLGGINHGLANAGFGNDIETLTDGRGWLASGYWGSTSMKYHSTCLVLRDGQMADKYVALCDLQLASDLPNSAFVRSVMHEYNGADWARDILWLKRKYWVLFDHMQIVNPADYSIFCQWRGAPISPDDEYRSTVTAHDHTLVIQAAGGTKPQGTVDEPGYGILSQSLHGQFDGDDEPTFATLIYGHEKTKPNDYSIKRLSNNTCLVTEPERQVLLGVAPLGKPDEPTVLGPGLQIKCTMFALAPDELAFAGLTGLGAGVPLLEADKPIDLSVDLAQGLVTLNATEDTKLTLRGLQVGDGAITPTKPTDVSVVDLKAGRSEFTIDAATAPVAAVAEAVRAAVALAVQAPSAAAETGRPAYPQQLARHWEFKVPEGKKLAVRTVEAADLDGDGRDEVFVGTADGRMICLAADGTQKWEFAAAGGVNDVAVADFGQGARVLVAGDDEYLHCLDAAGNELWKFTGRGIECTNQTRGTYGPGLYIEGDGEMMAIDVADINADGVREILVGSKTFTHGNTRVFGTLWCLNPAGKLQWHLYQSAGTVTSVKAFDDTGDGQMKIAIESGGGTYGVGGYLVDNQGNALNRQAAGYGERFCDVGKIAPDGAYRKVRVDYRTGITDVFETVEPYEKKWTYQAGGMSGAGPAVGDLNGDGIAEVLVGSGGGSLYCLNEAENPLAWRLNLAEPIAVVAIASLQPGSRQVIAGATTGGLHVISADGKPLARTALTAPLTCLRGATLQAGGADALIAATTDGSVVAFVLQ